MRTTEANEHDAPDGGGRHREHRLGGVLTIG